MQIKQTGQVGELGRVGHISRLGRSCDKRSQLKEDLGPLSPCHQADVMVDRVPRCPVCSGVTKPDIVFFGEPLPARFLLHLADFPMADLLLILGTSLEVCQQA